MSDDTVTLLAALLAGGVTGAIVGGLVALWTQSRAFRREDRYRFAELRRERYALFVRTVDEFVGRVATHALVLFDEAAEMRSLPQMDADALVPSSWAHIEPLPWSQDVSNILAEVTLLGRRDTREAALTLQIAARHLRDILNETYSEGATEREPTWIVEQSNRYSFDYWELRAERDHFIDVARAELGIEDRRWRRVRAAVAWIRGQFGADEESLVARLRQGRDDRRRAVHYAGRANLIAQLVDEDDVSAERAEELVDAWEEAGASTRRLKWDSPRYWTEGADWVRDRLGDRGIKRTVGKS